MFCSHRLGILNNLWMRPSIFIWSQAPQIMDLVLDRLIGFVNRLHVWFERRRGVRDNAKVLVSAIEAGVDVEWDGEMAGLLGLREHGSCRENFLGHAVTCELFQGPLWGEFSPLRFPAGPCPHPRMTLAWLAEQSHQQQLCPPWEQWSDPRGTVHATDLFLEFLISPQRQLKWKIPRLDVNGWIKTFN